MDYTQAATVLQADLPTHGAAIRTPGEKLRVFNRRRVLLTALVTPSLAVLPVRPAGAWLGYDFSDANALLVRDRADGIRVLSAAGNIIGALGAYYAPPVPRAQLPPHLIYALVAQEDRHFLGDSWLRVGGLDLRGVGRAMVSDLKHFRISQGGSTLTQQLLKDAFLRHDNKYARKIEEFALAPGLDHALTKDQIIFVYLNRIYFGSAAYGIGAAAKVYFDKPASHLSLHESAALIQAVPRPGKYNIRVEPEQATLRTHKLLDEMVALGFLSKRRAASAKRQSLHLAPDGRAGEGFFPKSKQHAWYATHTAVEIQSVFGAVPGVKSTKTYLDEALQSICTTVLARSLRVWGTRLGIEQGAVVALKPDGKIVALVGGSDYAESQWNNATQAVRQPGSAFKLFVYLHALQRGLRPTDEISNEGPLTYHGGSVRNHDDKYSERITLAEALARSSNVVAVRLAEGHEAEIWKLARRFGIPGEFAAKDNLALGTRELTLLQLTAAYATVANLGLPAVPYSFDSIDTDLGRVMHVPPRKPERVIDQATALMMQDLLTGVLRPGGTAAAANPGIWAAGKTGTTNNFRDAWFIGFTHSLVVGVWMGNTSSNPMKDVYGGGLPARLWREIIEFEHRSASPYRAVAAN